MEDELRALLRDDGWNRLYGDVRRESMGVQAELATVEASRPENRHLNRYRDVYPYDHSRVCLEGLEGTDYINASLVKCPRARRNYILAQGPLPTTVGHFWLAAWQRNSKAVVMLNRVMEKGQLKCHQYWPAEVGLDMIFNDVGLALENVHSVPGDHYTVRTLKLTHTESGESREILHFHYTTWPDFGVPQCPDTFLEFLRAVRDSGSLDEDVGPPFVHCSAGIGRSGTFCLVDTCLVLIAKEGQENVSIKDVLMELRYFRMGLIQTPDQLKFSYLAIAEGGKQAGLLNEDILAGLPETRVANSVSTDDSDDDGAPPPLPPPRSESLRMQQLLQNILTAQAAGAGAESNLIPNNMANSVHDNLLHVNGTGEQSASSGTGSGSDRSPDAEETWRSPKSPLLADLDGSKQTDSPTKCILNNDKMEERKREMEIRRRRKEELKSRVDDMHRKSQESDRWREWRNWGKRYVVPTAASALALVVVAGAIYYTKY